MQKLDPNQKIVIWGYPLHTHTHSYIHYGFYKAFKSLGYDVYWFNDQEIEFDFENCIFITEQGCIQHLPVVKTSKYFIHNISSDFKNQIRIDHDQVYNLLVYHENYSWNDSIQQIDEFSWYDSTTKSVVIMWATDLLPQEIDQMHPVLYDNSKTSVNFVGTVQGDNLVKFAHICAEHGKNFYNLGGYTGSSLNNDLHFYDQESSIKELRNSYLSFDIREDSHVNNGYVPCRIFKNISYGLWTGCNSFKLSKFFDSYITIEENLENLYDLLENDLKTCTVEKIQKSMNIVRSNHTYINRIQSLFSIL